MTARPARSQRRDCRRSGDLPGRVGPRLKLGGGDLGNLLTLEALSLGVEGKACMWKTLKHVHSGSVAFASGDFDALIKRAEDQRAGLEQWRLTVATVALSEETRPAFEE